MLVILTALLLFALSSPLAFAWDQERPDDQVTIDEKEQRSDTNDIASVGLGVHIVQYQENHPLDGDYLELALVATANTRTIIQYGLSEVGYKWYNVADPVYVGDNGVATLIIPYPIRFYGGHKSAEYTQLWVTSNGFIGLDPFGTPTDPYYSQSIPNNSTPNAFIAPFWRDLNLTLGSSITWGIVEHDPGPGEGSNAQCVVISWNNVLNKKNGVPQTFQVLIELAPEPWPFDPYPYYRQSRIWFHYKSITLDDQTTIGIEDQLGRKGVSYNYLSLSDKSALMFKQTSNSAYIEYLTIRLSKVDDPDAEVDIVDAAQDPSWVRGTNVMLTSNETDSEKRFKKALFGSGVLLIEVFEISGILLPGTGLMLGAISVGLDWIDVFAEQHSPAQPFEVNDGQTENYVKVQAQDYVVDASLGVRIFWKFTDEPNSQTHKIRITSEVQYILVRSDGIFNDGTIWTASKTLEVWRDAGNDFDNAKTVFSRTYKAYLGPKDPVDFFKIDASPGYILTVKITPRRNSDFDLYLYDPARTRRASSSSPGNVTEGISFSPDSSGWWYIEARYVSGEDGMYLLEVTLTVTGGGGGGGGGGLGPWIDIW